MESRIRRFLLTAASAGLMASFSGASWAERSLATAQDPGLEPRIVRTDLQEDDIDTEYLEVGLFYGHLGTEDFGTNEVIGGALTFHATEDFFFEAAGGKSDTQATSAERINPLLDLGIDEDRELTYYNLSIGWNVLPGEVFFGENRAFNTAIYVIAGAGATDFLGDKQFTINGGAGLRVLLTDWLAVHLDGREYVFDSDALGSDITYNLLEFRAGLSAFF